MDIARAAHLLEDDIVRFCQRLVRTPSLSGDEGAVAELLLDRLDRTFDEVFIDPLGSVVGRIEGGDGPSILFNGHMDTIPPGDREAWSCEPFCGTVVDGKVFGRGAVDMKGALAAMAFMGDILAKAGIEPPGERIVCFVVHEETCEGLAMRHLLEEGRVHEPALVVLGEATGLDLAIGHRGRAEVTLTTTGVSAHASMPHLGENALMGMIRVLDRLDTVRLPANDLLGRGTQCAVGIGCTPGDGPVVPERCTVQIDRRTVMGETAEDVVDQYRELLESIGLEGAMATLRRHQLRCHTGLQVEGEAFYPAWLLPDGSALGQGCLRTLEAVGLSPTATVWNFSTDGAYTAGIRNIPTVGFGPGDESLAHRPDEHVPVGELVRAATGYAAIAASGMRRVGGYEVGDE